jgi:predicted MFS family arabinose efflux permease
MSEAKPKERIFTRYQVFVIAILSMLQFSVILDFMVLSPLGAILMDKLHVTTSQFGLVVSAYAFSAGAAGLLTAGLQTNLTGKNCCFFSMPVLSSEPYCVRLRQVTRSCWARVSLPEYLAG